MHEKICNKSDCCYLLPIIYYCSILFKKPFFFYRYLNVTALNRKSQLIVNDLNYSFTCTDPIKLTTSIGLKLHCASAINRLDPSVFNPRDKLLTRNRYNTPGR